MSNKKILLQESSSTCFGSSKMSRMSLVDLAGFDKNIPDDAGKQFVKEGKYVKKSTSLLGYGLYIQFIDCSCMLWLLI